LRVELSMTKHPEQYFLGSHRAAAYEGARFGGALLLQTASQAT
jgi:hypothetical protein